MVSGIGEAKLAATGQGDVSVKATINGITLDGKGTDTST